MADEAILKILMQEDPSQPSAAGATGGSAAAGGLFGGSTLGQMAGAIGGQMGGIPGAAMSLVGALKGGPVGIATAAWKVGSMVADASANLVTSMGEVATGFIKLGGVDAVGAVGSGMQNIGKQLGPFGIGLQVAGAALQAFTSIVNAVSDYAKKLSEYSPVLAQAEAQAELRQIMGDIRRSREAGPQLARFVEARSRFEQSWEDLKVRFITMIEPLLTRVLELLKDVADGVANVYDASMAAIEYWQSKIPTIIQGEEAQKEHQAKAAEYMKKIFERMLGEGDVADIWASIKTPMPHKALDNAIKAAVRGELKQQGKKLMPAGLF
jgi:hypothetical protein